MISLSGFKFPHTLSLFVQLSPLQCCSLPHQPSSTPREPRQLSTSMACKPLAPRPCSSNAKCGPCGEGGATLVVRFLYSFRNGRKSALVRLESLQSSYPAGLCGLTLGAISVFALVACIVNQNEQPQLSRSGFTLAFALRIFFQLWTAFLLVSSQSPTSSTS